MDIRTIAVAIDLETPASPALTAAIDLAQRCKAKLIGVAADQPAVVGAGLDGGTAALDFYQAELDEIQKRFKSAEKAFDVQAGARPGAEWRSFVASPERAMIATGLSADLLVLPATISAVYGSPRPFDAGEVVLASGRPTIALAASASKVSTDSIIIGWKDTREARRAVADALPFLRDAKDVLAITISEGNADSEKQSLADLVTWLDVHGVKARTERIENQEGFIDVLESTARARNADMIVTGGYGHSRMREWLFGGMTRDLLEATDITRFFSN
ncbi:MAG TPA: universal stress protein [Devosia sp.]|nr:universal stress protein [Devosia sp.]